MKRPFNHTADIKMLRKEIIELRADNKSLGNSLTISVKQNEKLISWITDLIKANGYNISDLKIPVVQINSVSDDFQIGDAKVTREEEVTRIPEIVFKKVRFPRYE